MLQENIEESPHEVLRERASGTVSNGLRAKEIIFTGGVVRGGDGWQALGQLEGTVCTDPGGEREFMLDMFEEVQVVQSCLIGV